MTVNASEEKKPRTLPKEERREQVLQAAVEVFADKGYHQANVSEIMERCGLGKGTFYLYFKSKREIFGALLDQFTEAIYVSFFIPGATEVKTGRDVRDRFERIMGLALLMLRENRDLARIFLLEGVTREPGFEDKVRKFYELLINGAAANLKLWMDQGLLRPADPLTIAHCVVGMVERLTLQWAAGTITGDFEAMVAEVVKFELYGILKDPAEAFRD